MISFDWVPLSYRNSQRDVARRCGGDSDFAESGVNPTSLRFLCVRLGQVTFLAFLLFLIPRSPRQLHPEKSPFLMPHLR